MEKALASKNIAQFCAIIAALILLILTVGLTTVGVPVVPALIALGAAVILLAYSLLFPYFQSRTLRRIRYEGGERDSIALEYLSQISDTQLRDRYLGVLALSTMGMVEATPSVLQSILDVPPTITGEIVEYEATKEIAAASPAITEDVNGADMGGETSHALPDNWDDPVLSRLDAIRELRQGWYDGDGLPVEPGVLSLSYAIGSRLSVAIDGKVGIFPTVEGGVQFEWDSSNGSVSVEILPDHAIEVAVLEFPDGVVRREIVTERNLADLLEKLRRM